MKKILNNQYNKIEFVTVYDNTHLVDEIISKYKTKFSKYSVGISYTKEPTKCTITSEDKDIEIDALKITIDIEIPLLKHEGWTYYGMVESVPILDENEKNMGYENMLYSSIPENEILAKYSKLDKFRCDHCNTNHYRKTVHIFKHDDGREFVIGTACSKEYFGIDIHKSLCNILNLFPRISDFAEDLEETFRMGGYSDCLNKTIIAKLAYGVISEQKRFISKSSCDEFSREIPTSSYVSNLYYSNEKEDREESNKILDSLKDKNIIEPVREYWMAKESDDTFTHNVQTSLKMVSPKLGLIVYAVWEYMKEVEDFTGKNKFGVRLKNSTHIGVVGEKIKNKEVEIYSVSSFETMYGVTFIISMIDDNDNVIVWKTSSPTGEKGEKRVIKTAIIKEHTDYKGINQTMVKNLKFVE